MQRFGPPCGFVTGAVGGIYDGQAATCAYALTCKAFMIFLLGSI